MSARIHESIRDEKGFTLVELAVVMVIIGLLIGGVLKGQEMIANAQVTSTIAQTKAIDAATATFRDIFEAFPGDMSDATTRIAGCGACTNGDGNNQIDVAPFAAIAGESDDFFLMLEAADLVNGVNAANYMDGNIAGTELHVGYTAGGAIGQHAGARRGHYLTVTPAGAAGGAILTPLEAGRIDRKVDDGDPTAGSAFADLAACVDGNGYDEDSQAASCSIAVRIQG